VVVLLLGVALGEAAKHGVVPFDRTLTEHFSNFTRSHPVLRHFWQTVTFFGSSAWLTTLVVVGAIVLIVRRALGAALDLVLCTSIGTALSTVLKIVVDRPRPAVGSELVRATGLSFPSGHAMNSTVVYGALVLVFGAGTGRGRRIVARIAISTTVALIACSRLALGVHYFSDVVGGVVLGATWLTLTPISRRSSASDHHPRRR
jgi:undecaprenyl-diphosphatase